MNLVDSITTLKSKLNDLSILISEDKGHLDHPEDLVILKDIQGAKQALSSILKTAQNPKSITIKWDGYPALIFGRNAQGKFSIMDKHMFNKKDGTGRQIFSPEEFIKYDTSRGVDRSGLHQLISEIWPNLEKASQGSSGYYWGDLLFSKPLQDQNGVYAFKANPNGITYKVDANSNIGKLLTGKTAGIAVHQKLAADAPSTDSAESLNGTIGELKNNSQVAIVPSAMPITPNIKLDNNLVKEVQSAINQYGNDVQKLMNSAPQARNTFNQLFTTYINKKIVSGDLNDLVLDFLEYVQTRPMTEVMREKIDQHLKNNQEGVVGLFTIWVAMYKLKMSIVEQLNKAAESSPVKGYLQSGVETQEGFVSQGLKFVDRMGFSRQNLAGR